MAVTPVLEQGGSPRPGCPKGGSWPCGGKGFVPMAHRGAWSPFGCPQAHIAARDSRVWCWALSKMPQTPQQHPSSRVPQGQRCPQPRKSPSGSAARSLLHQAPGDPRGQSQPPTGAEHLSPRAGVAVGQGEARYDPSTTLQHPPPHPLPPAGNCPASHAAPQPPCLAPRALLSGTWAGAVAPLLPRVLSTDLAEPHPLIGCQQLGNRAAASPFAFGAHGGAQPLRGRRSRVPSCRRRRVCTHGDPHPKGAFLAVVCCGFQALLWSFKEAEAAGQDPHAAFPSSSVHGGCRSLPARACCREGYF